LKCASLRSALRSAQFPDATSPSRADTPLPDRVSQFVFPDGCSPVLRERPPTFFTFVLTMETGLKMYGAAMQIYEDIDAAELVGQVKTSLSDEARRKSKSANTDSDSHGNNNYSEDWPDWLKISKESERSNSQSSSVPHSRTSSPLANSNLAHDDLSKVSASLRNISTLTPPSPPSGSSSPPAPKPGSGSGVLPEIVFLPKTLVVLSHYAFHNAFRSFLQQLYRISLAGAPLPIERYIANFAMELPLPPRGRVEVSERVSLSLRLP